jgi:hypothetical protein
MRGMTGLVVKVYINKKVVQNRRHMSYRHRMLGEDDIFAVAVAVSNVTTIPQCRGHIKHGYLSNSTCTVILLTRLQKTRSADKTPVYFHVINTTSLNTPSFRSFDTINHSTSNHLRPFRQSTSSSLLLSSPPTPAYSSFSTISKTSSALNPACRNLFPSLKSPHWTPLSGKSSNCVVATVSTLTLPYICGMKPSRLQVNAQQHTPVNSKMRSVAIHSGYAA